MNPNMHGIHIDVNQPLQLSRTYRHLNHLHTLQSV